MAGRRASKQKRDRFGLQARSTLPKVQSNDLSLDPPKKPIIVSPSADKKEHLDVVNLVGADGLRTLG